MMFIYFFLAWTMTKFVLLKIYGPKKAVRSIRGSKGKAGGSSKGGKKDNNKGKDANKDKKEASANEDSKGKERANNPGPGKPGDKNL